MSENIRAVAARVRKSLSAPSSVMGGESFTLNTRDVLALVEFAEQQPN